MRLCRRFTRRCPTHCACRRRSNSRGAPGKWGEGFAVSLPPAKATFFWASDHHRQNQERDLMASKNIMLGTGAALAGIGGIAAAAVTVNPSEPTHAAAAQPAEK